MQAPLPLKILCVVMLFAKGVFAQGGGCQANITINGSAVFCQGDTRILVASAGASYLWSTGDTAQAIVVTGPGLYSVAVTDSLGCIASAGQSISVLPELETAIVPNATVPYCTGDEITLTAIGVPFIDQFEWSNGEVSQSISVTQTGIYTVTVTNGIGCTAQASLPIGFLPLPPNDIFVNGETSICEGDEVTLTALAPPFGFDFEWNTGETSQSITVTEAGDYSVTVTSVAGCESTSDDVTIDVVPGPTVDAGPDLVICAGDTVVLTTTGGENVTWMPGGEGPSIEVSPLDDTSYIVEVTNDGCGQVAVDTVNIVVQAYPTAYFNVGETNLGEPVLFTDSSQVPPLFSWEWDFGDGNFSNEQNPSNDYEAPGEYEVTLVVSTSGGCADTAAQVIDVQEFFVITNVLTPNSDGVNDYVRITSSLAELIEAKVYNRWGFSVWEGVGTDLRFYGKTPEGVHLQAGTYYYTFIVNYPGDKMQQRQGFLEVLR